MSAIGFLPAPRGKGFALSAHAEWRHEHLFFERQQSLAMRGMEWEERVRPLTPWSTLILRGIGAAAVLAAALAILV